MNRAQRLDSALMTFGQKRRTVGQSRRLRVSAGGPSKVRTGFEDAQLFRKVRILENPEDFFEDAHPFPRCAPKTEDLQRTTGRNRPVRRQPNPVNFSFFVEIVHGTARRAPLIHLAAFLDGSQRIGSCD
jgi:hypothetical protein